jgi:prephenate dehydrogenase
MAGVEKTGVSAAREDLFVSAVCVVTPTKKSKVVAVRKTEQFWKSLGARTLRLAPEQHDVLVSRSSHLPHVVAAALANLVLAPGSPEFQSALCASGFRDTTRIASGSPEMWRDIALANRKNLSRSVDAFVSELQQFQQILKKSDAKAISKFLETAKTRRDNWCACLASTSSE